MIQLHPRAFYRGLYGGHQIYGFIDGTGFIGVPLEPPGVVIPIDCTVRNLSFLNTNAGHPLMTLSVQKNGVDTALAIALAAGDTSINKNSASVSFAQGDYISTELTGVSQPFVTAFPWTACLETEADENIYGLNANVGGATAAVYGGAFGNGSYQNFSGFFANHSNTYSLAALDGNITRLASLAFSGAPGGGGSWDSYIIVNSVLQDGTGGTVDTKCSITGSNTFALSTFVLPILITDIVDIYTIKVGTPASSGFYHVSTSVTFNPTIPGRYMFCGGSNAAIEAGVSSWRWVENHQNEATELNVAAVIGVGGVDVHGLYCRAKAPGGSDNILYTLRRNLTSTSIVATMTGSSQTASAVGDEVYPEDSSIDIQVDPDSGADTGSFHWGIPVSAIEPPPGNGTIIVQKITSPASSIQEFDFDTSGGLVPSTFELQNGETQSFDVAPGTYGVSEEAIDNWDTVVTVSNGDDADAITIGSGDVVTVTFTNSIQAQISSGIYKIIPNSNKTNDTLWDDGFAGTHDVKIP